MLLFWRQSLHIFVICLNKWRSYYFTQENQQKYFFFEKLNYTLLSKTRYSSAHFHLVYRTVSMNRYNTSLGPKWIDTKKDSTQPKRTEKEISSNKMCYMKNKNYHNESSFSPRHVYMKIQTQKQSSKFYMQ